MIAHLLAMDSNRTIGKNNDLPWHLPADLAYFKRVTMGNTMVMGRKTFESIGKALPGRENIVLTRDTEYNAPGCTMIYTVEAIEVLAKQRDEEIFVIGGAQLFQATLPITDRLYITLIEAEFEGDTFYPEIKEEEWELVSKEKGIKDEKNPYDYYFLIYERKKTQ